MTPKIIDWHQKFNFGGPRKSKIQAVFIHTTENDIGTPAENVANYQIRTRTGSYHCLVDTQKLLIENTDDWITWSTGNLGNDVGLHMSFVARAAMTRQQWLNNRAMLSIGAWKVAQWCRAYGIPAKFVTGPELARGVKGVSTHFEARIWGNTDHTDPGPNFPMQEFLEMVRTHMTGKAPAGGNNMTAFHEINKRFKSRVPGSNVEMRPIDALMNIDRHTWETRQEVRELSNAIRKISERLDSIEGKS